MMKTLLLVLPEGEDTLGKPTLEKEVSFRPVTASTSVLIRINMSNSLPFIFVQRQVSRNKDCSVESFSVI